MLSERVSTAVQIMKTTGTVRTSTLDWTSLVLVIVGAINWGLVGVGNLLDANWNVVNLVLGSFPTIEALVYLVVGLAGLYEISFAYQLYSARTAESESEETTARRTT